MRQLLFWILLSQSALAQTTSQAENQQENVAPESNNAAQSEVAAEDSGSDATQSDGNAAQPDAAAEQSDGNAAQSEVAAERSESSAHADRAAQEESRMQAEAAPPLLQKTKSPAVESDAAAKAAFERADLLYVQGDYQTSLQQFQLAYELSGHIELLYNIANCFERLGNYHSASVALAGYLPHAPASRRAILEKRLEHLRKEAQAQDEENQARVRELRVMAMRDVVPVKRAIGFSTLGFGIAALATGTGLMIGAGASKRQLNDLCVQTGEMRYCPATADNLLQKERTLVIAADVAFVLGGLSVLTGSILLYQSKKEEKSLSAFVSPRAFGLQGAF